VLLDVAVDRTEIAADDTDLAYITITLVDGSGNLYNTADRKVAIEVKGPGVLQGFGGANPLSEENFFDTVRGTFEGRAVAVVRPTAVGTITVTLTADDCDAQTVRIDAVDFKTQKRAPKMTASFFREVAARNRVM
jgi:beta-galactosidase